MQFRISGGRARGGTEYNFDVSSIPRRPAIRIIQSVGTLQPTSCHKLPRASPPKKKFTPPSRVQHRVANFLYILPEELYLLFNQRLSLRYALLLFFALCVVCRLLLPRFGIAGSSAGHSGIMGQGNERKSLLKSFRNFLTPVRGSNPGRARFFARLDRPWGHPASCTMGTGSLPGVKYGLGVLLTTHPFCASVMEE